MTGSKRSVREKVLKPIYTDLCLEGYGQCEFLRGLEDAFDEPGDFTIEHSDEMIILTTKSGTQIRAFAREIIYLNQEPV